MCATNRRQRDGVQEHRGHAAPELLRDAVLLRHLGHGADPCVSGEQVCLGFRQVRDVGLGVVELWWQQPVGVRRQRGDGALLRCAH